LPIFDYHCDACGKDVIDEFVHHWDSVVKCPKCGTVMTKLVVTRIVADTFPTDGVFLENVSAEGKRFYSKREMKNYARDNKLQLGYLL
jgi:putative FmdB family regulatory protein